MFNAITTIIAMSSFMVLFMAMADLNAYRRSTVLPLLKNNGYKDVVSELFSFWNFSEIYREYEYVVALRSDPKADRIAKSFHRRIILIAVFSILLFLAIVIQLSLQLF